MAAPAVEKVPSWLSKRAENLRTLFKDEFGTDPLFFAHSPGRVNIIGEHIDYCGYAVLPMAIEQDILIAVNTSSEKKLNLRNIDKKYSDFTCDLNTIHIDKTNPKWQHYFLCGYKGILDHFNLTDGVGMNLLVDGSVPPSAGLSSSSAFVCSAALATMHANGETLTKLELAHLCQHCEYHIGTEGGGMDQSIAFLAQKGTAKLIEFNPIRATDVQLPEGAVFVISNSCADMNKAATSHFNTRVAECRLAAQIIASKKGLDWRSIKTLGQLQNKLGLPLADMTSIVDSILHKAPYSKQEICDLLGVTTDELNSISLSERTYGVEQFALYARATHVYSEAERVWQFKATCDAGGADCLQHLGALMFASHASCRDMYECSCTELDQLVELARASGALGSRLTGAGWGGCAVSLVPTDKLDSFLQRMREGYYAQSDARMAKVEQALFATKPGGGAGIYTVE